MSLDTKQKQGSAIGMGLPFRQWLAEPTATIGEGERLSLIKFCAEPLAEALVIHQIPLTLRSRSRALPLRSRP